MLAETDSKVVKASIIATTTAKDWNDDEFTLYIIQTENETKDTQFILRRYNQFYQLHQHLSENDLISKEVELPPKRWFWNLDKDVVDERRSLLGIYMQALLSTEKSNNDSKVQSFFAPQLPPAEAKGSGSSSLSVSSSGVIASTSTMVPVSNQFGWENRNIWDPTNTSLASLLSEELARLRARLFQLKHKTSLSSLEEAERDKVAQQVRYLLDLSGGT